MGKKWNIQEGLYFEKLADDMIALCYDPDEAEVIFTIEDIDNVIDQLKRIKSEYKTKEMIRKQKEAMARWGKEKTPLP